MDYHLVLSTRWHKHQDYIEIKYPLAGDKEPVSSQGRYVYFLDSGLGYTSLLPDEMPREPYIATMNRLLQALTDLYEGQDVVLLFKGNPANREIPYDLAGFDVFDGNVTAEMIFVQRRKEIRAVYTTASTSAPMASLVGIDSYVFDEMFDFPKRLRDRHKRYLLDFSDVVSIRSMDELQLPPPKANTSPLTTDQDLERLAQLFQELMTSC